MINNALLLKKHCNDIITKKGEYVWVNHFIIMQIILRV